MKDFYAFRIKNELIQLLKYIMESRDFQSDCYGEVDEIINNIDKLIKTRIDDALKEHSADSIAHNN